MIRRLAAAAIAATLAGCAAPKKNGFSAPASPLEEKLGRTPNDAQVNLALAEEAERGGDLLRAEQYYLRAEALGLPQAEIVPRILGVLAKARRYDEALQRCRRRLAEVPDDRAARFVEAALLQALERPKEAERALSLLVKTKPDDPLAYLALGRHYREVGDRSRGRDMLRKYLELSPDGDEAAAVRFELSEDADAQSSAEPVEERLP